MYFVHINFANFLRVHAHSINTQIMTAFLKSLAPKTPISIYVMPK